MCCRLLFVSIFALVLAGKDISAQNSGLSETTGAVSSRKDFYRLPAFTEGMVTFRNGGSVTAKLNYNINVDEMHFINPQGDTLALADPPAVNFIDIGQYRFYYDKGYLQSIPAAGDIILAFKQVLTEEKNTKGAFGIGTTHPDANSYSYFTLKGQQYKLGDEETQIETRTFYFFGDAYGHFSKASKEYILNRYAKQQEAVSIFLKNNHISFNKAEDLTKLLAYCKQLQ